MSNGDARVTRPLSRRAEGGQSKARQEKCMIPSPHRIASFGGILPASPGVPTYNGGSKLHGASPTRTEPTPRLRYLRKPAKALLVWIGFPVQLGCCCTLTELRLTEETRSNSFVRVDY